jgi:hypothetical protein
MPTFRIFTISKDDVNIPVVSCTQKGKGMASIQIVIMQKEMGRNIQILSYRKQKSNINIRILSWRQERMSSYRFYCAEMETDINTQMHCTEGRKEVNTYLFSKMEGGGRGPV